MAAPGEPVTRVCAAVMAREHILMVKHRHGGEEYWTLPGGRVGVAEPHEQAVVRELLEETGLRGKVVRLLFIMPVSSGDCACYLVDVADPAAVVLGRDPELSADEQWLAAAAWLPIADMADDIQVAQVLRALADESPRNRWASDEHALAYLEVGQ